MNGGGEGDVGRVVIVAGLLAEVRGLEAATVMSDSLGREGEGLDAMGTTAAAGVEM